MAEPYELSLSESAQEIASGQLSPVELAQSLLGRIDAKENLQAWVTIDREEVLGAAARAEEAVAQGTASGALHGVPIGLKDIFYTAGMKTTACSPLYADFVPDYDATVVAKLKEAGAIVLGKAVTTEFATADPSPTLNPWNHAHTPGGSSSGSSVAVATSMCAGALGSQTGGSTCRPASYNGIVGLKPTYGRLSKYGVIPASWSLDTVGILVRDVTDATLMLQVMAGYDPNDPSSAHEPVLDYVSPVADYPMAPRIRLIRQHFLEVCDDETRANTQAAFDKFADLGCEADEVRLPASFDTCYSAHRVVMDVECATFHEELFSQHPDQYGRRLRSTIETGLLLPGVRYLQAQRMRTAFARDMRELVADGAILVTPTTPAAAPRDLNTTGDPIFQSPWTSCGLPTITLPSGLSADGLPLGVQLIGAPFREDELLCAARWCEAALRVNMRPPEG